MEEYIMGGSDLHDASTLMKWKVNILPCDVPFDGLRAVSKVEPLSAFAATR